MIETTINGIKIKSIKRQAKELAKLTIKELEQKLGIEHDGSNRRIAKSANR